MSEERKKVSVEQLKILIEELENDATLLSGRGLVRSAPTKLDHIAKWKQLAKKLNSVENGALKNVSKWQQSLRDWKNNTKKKAAKVYSNKNRQSDGSQELTNLELRLIALYKSELSPQKAVGIDISSITEVDPLSSDDNSGSEEIPFLNTYTAYTCDANNENTSCSVEHPEDGQCKVKRKRVQVISEDILSQQNSLLARLTELEASRQEAENRQNRLLEAVTSALERHTAATAGLARAADAQAHVLRQILGVLTEKRQDT